MSRDGVACLEQDPGQLWYYQRLPSAKAFELTLPHVADFGAAI